MSKQQQKEDSMENQPVAAEEGGEEAALKENSAIGTDEGLEALKAALEEATAQAAENWDKYVRANAEMDNMSKRLRRDVEHAHKFAIEKLINELLPVWDSLEMGLDHAGGGSIDPDKLKEGHEMTLRMLAKVMEKFNVIPIDPVGEVFNPELHEAMTMQPSDAVDANCVLTVIQKGYLLNDRLIRPAMVVVSKAAVNGGDSVGKNIDEQA